MSKLSIITINYNDKVGLEKTICSVIDQTYEDFEFIVIDGGSTDGSKKIIEKHQNKISHWKSEPDTGIYNAMNKGIKIAKGEFLLFLNSGDFLVSNDILENVIKLLKGNFGIFYGDLRFFDNKKKRYQEKKIQDKLSLGFFVNDSLPHQATFIKKELFNTISLYNENLKIVSDWEFCVKAICVEKTPYKHIDLVISEYDFTGISSNPKNRELILSEMKQTLDKLFPIIIEDYKDIVSMKSRQIQDVLYIRKFNIPWKLLKGFSKIILLFLPKQKKIK